MSSFVRCLELRCKGWVVIAVMTASSPGARAQNAAAIPARPGIGVNADTNDAKAYYAWGTARLSASAEEAARAFYWAARIDPSWADAYYAEWAARQMSEPHRLDLYLKGDKGVRRSSEIRAIDSLYLRAVRLNPFLIRRYEGMMYEQSNAFGGTTTTVGRLETVNTTTVDSSMIPGPGFGMPPRPTAGTPTRRGSSSVYAKPWIAYSMQNYPRALQDWAALLPSSKDRSVIFAQRGWIFALVASYDSAAAQLRQAAAEWRADEKDYVGTVFQSRAIYDFSLGLALERMDHPDSARMAYQRSLDADSADAAPHVRLSALAFATGDTAAALRELSSATRVQPQDAVIAYLNGSTLVRVGRDSGAVAELRRAEALDPWYAAPRILLALIYDAQGKNAEAIAEFRAFIGIASEKNALLPRARERLAALTMAPPAAAAPPAP